jgi:hypothetical protein
LIKKFSLTARSRVDRHCAKVFLIIFGDIFSMLAGRTETVIIRLAAAADWAHLRQAIVELQDYERLPHTTRLPGEQVADAYVEGANHRATKQRPRLVSAGAD